MARVTLTLPDGNYFVNPDAYLIAEILADPQRYFTNESCGEIAIEYKGDDILTYAGIRSVGQTKYSIEWTMREGPDAADSAAIILPRPLDAETVVTYVGGMPLHLPQASVISRDEAVSIATSFCKDGRVPVEWKPVRLGTLPPDAYFWGDHPRT